MTAADKIAEANGPERIWAHGNCMGRLGRPLLPGVSSHWATWETRTGDPNHATEYVRADLVDAQAQEIARLRGLLWYAWHEFNAIRARDGAPRGSDTCCGRLGPTLVSEEWWNTLTEAFADAIGTDARTPWPSPEAKDVGETLKATP